MANKFPHIQAHHWEWAELTLADLPLTLPATDPGDIADPTLATAEDVALKLNTLMANLRTAGLIA